MSTRPELWPWASNVNHPAGANPWNGQPTKVEPSSGRKAGGFEPVTAAAPEHMNWLLHNVSGYLDWLAAIQAGTWQDASALAVTGGSWGGAVIPRAMCYDPSNLAFHGIASTGFVIHSVDDAAAAVGPVGGLGTTYRDEAGALPSGTWAGGGTYVDIEADDAGARVAVSDSANGQLMEAATPGGGWTARAPATGAVAWSHVEYDPAAALWLIGGNGGEVETSPDRITWTARAPGLAGTQITAMKANRDTANPMVIAVDSTTVARSSDGGVTWSNYLHLLGSAPSGLAYDAATGRWLMTMGTPSGVLYSDDQGATWTAATTPTGMLTPTGPTAVDIDSDQMGCFLLVVDGAPGAAAGVRQMFSTRDGAATWAQVPHPATRVSHTGGTVLAPWSAGVRFGGGRWATIGETSTPTAAALFSGLVHP